MEVEDKGKGEEIELEGFEGVPLGEQKSDDSPTISLHALTGSIKHQTMRVQGFLGHQKVNVLIDSRSTHNFVHPSMAKGLNKMKDLGTTLKVYAADGAARGHFPNPTVSL